MKRYSDKYPNWLLFCIIFVILAATVFLLVGYAMKKMADESDVSSPEPSESDTGIVMPGDGSVIPVVPPFDQDSQSGSEGENSTPSSIVTPDSELAVSAVPPAVKPSLENSTLDSISAPVSEAAPLPAYAPGEESSIPAVPQIPTLPLKSN